MKNAQQRIAGYQSGVDGVKGATLRTGSDGQIFRTDGRHYILDCALGSIQSPPSLQVSWTA